MAATIIRGGDDDAGVATVVQVRRRRPLYQDGLAPYTPLFPLPRRKSVIFILLEKPAQ